MPLNQPKKKNNFSLCLNILTFGVWGQAADTYRMLGKMNNKT